MNKRAFLFLGIPVLLFVLLLVYFATSRQPGNETQVPGLNKEEQQYTTAPTQDYDNVPKNAKTGVLIVTSNPSNAKVMIDSANDAEMLTEPINIPINNTPFKVTDIPSGKRVISVGLQGYVWSYKTVTIKAGEVTRIHFDLIPLASP